MRKNIKLLQKSKQYKPQDQLHQFSWNDYMDQNYQLFKQKTETWNLQPWLKQKIYKQSPQQIKSPYRQRQIQKKNNYIKKQYDNRPHTIEPKATRSIYVRTKTQCKPSLVSFKPLQEKRYQSIPMRQRVSYKNQQGKNSVRKRSLDITISDFQRPISLIQYPVTMNIAKKKKRYFGKLDKLLSQTKD